MMVLMIVIVSRRIGWVGCIGRSIRGCFWRRAMIMIMVGRIRLILGVGTYYSSSSNNSSKMDQMMVRIMVSSTGSWVNGRITSHI